MIDLLKQTFELWVKKRWLKTIEKEVDKYNKIEAERKIQLRIVNDLVKRYNQLYSNDRIKARLGKDEKNSSV